MAFYNHLEGINDSDKLKIYKTIKQYCNLDDEEIHAHYKRWKDHTPGTGNKNGYCNEAFIDVIKITQQFKLIKPSNAYCHGIDFPYWINWGEEKAKIMVIGINANRKLKDWKEFKQNEQEQLLINSGWGAHNEFKFDKEYYNYFSSLSENSSFYFTDFQKLFFWWDCEAAKHNSYAHESFVSAANMVHKQILLDEIKIIQPKIIIAFGNQVPEALNLSKKYFNESERKFEKFRVTKQELVRQNYEGIPFFHFPHVSKEARQHQIEVFYEKNNVPNDVRKSRGTAYAYILKRALNGH